MSTKYRPQPDVSLCTLAPICLSLSGNVPDDLGPIPPLLSPLLDSGQVEEVLPDAELLRLRDRVRELEAIVYK